MSGSSLQCVGVRSQRHVTGSRSVAQIAMTCGTLQRKSHQTWHWSQCQICCECSLTCWMHAQDSLGMSICPMNTECKYHGATKRLLYFTDGHEFILTFALHTKTSSSHDSIAKQASYPTPTTATICLPKTDRKTLIRVNSLPVGAALSSRMIIWKSVSNRPTDNLKYIWDRPWYTFSSSIKKWN